MSECAYFQVSPSRHLTSASTHMTIPAASPYWKRTRKEIDSEFWVPYYLRAILAIQFTKPKQTLGPFIYLTEDR